MARGQTESSSFLIGLIVTIAIIAVFIFAMSGFFSSSNGQKLTAAKLEFSNLSNFYRLCLENQRDNCICGSFNLSEITSKGYNVFLNKFSGQSNLILTEKGNTPDGDGLMAPEDIASQMPFKEDIVCTFDYTDSGIKDASQRVIDVSTAV